MSWLPKNRMLRIVVLAAMVLVGLALLRTLFDDGYRSPFGGFGLFGPLGQLLGIWWVINLALAIWVYIDAQKRGQEAILWSALTFFAGIIGLIVYLIVVSGFAGGRLTPGGGANVDGTTGAAPPSGVSAGAAPAAGSHAGGAPCVGCGRELREDFKHCPFCGRPTSTDCGSCGSPLEPGWMMCPRCGAPVEDAVAREPSPSEPPASS